MYIHPFAEEMNKSRRMAAMQSRALAHAGFAVLQIDLLGCGDSSGDFGDATWSAWIADVVHACHWLQQRHRAPAMRPCEPPLWLWGLRAGCLLAVEAAQQLDSDCHFLLWQPTPSGKLVLQQFLRLKLAGELLGGQMKGMMHSMRAELDAGQAVEVAGYTLQSDLTHGLEKAALAVPPLRPGRVEWLEISARADADLPPSSAAVAARWTQAGWNVHTRSVAGPAFWQSTEIEEAPALLAATLEAVVKPASPSVSPAAMAAASA